MLPLQIQGWGNTYAIDDINNAYEQIKDLIDVQAFQAIVAAIIIFGVSANIYKQYDEISHTESGTPNGGHFFQLFGKQVFVLIIIAFLPVGLTLIENIFSKTMDQLCQHLTGGTGLYNINDMFYKPVHDRLTSIPQMFAENFVQGLAALTPTSMVDYALSFVAGGIVAPIYMYMDIIYLAGRYMFLLLLELISPVAIACYIIPDLKQHFYTWLRSMFCCYLLLPCFIIASLFSDAIVCVIAKEETISVTLLVIFSLLLKCSLLNIVKQKLPQII